MTKTNLAVQENPQSNTPERAKFLQGSTMKHVVSMSLVGSVGLISMFAVDLIDIYFLSLLDDWTVMAAMGYATTVTFFTTSFGLGLSVTAASFISRAVGQKDNATADRLVGHIGVYTMGFMVIYSVIVYVHIQDILFFIGASRKTALLAQDYLEIIIPSAVFVALAITSSAVLRSFGDGRRSMYVTLTGAVVNLVLDPIFIFALDMGIEGAAIATVLSRFTMVCVGAYCIFEIHQVIPRINMGKIGGDFVRIAKFSTVAMFTNLASPLGNTLVIMWLAPHGDSVISAWSVWGRLVPVFFGITFALSGAVGPIIGQNYGACNMVRVRAVIKNALIFSCFIIVFASTVGFILRYTLADAFSLNAESTKFFVFLFTYCSWLFIFNAMVFISNAIFNSLGAPHYSSLFSWARHILGVLPFVMVGGYFYGAQGVALFAGLGGVVFGILSYYYALKYVDKMDYKIKANNQRGNAPL